MQTTPKDPTIDPAPEDLATSDTPDTPGPRGAPRELKIAPEHAGGRLDRVLATLLGISRRQTRELLARGAVALNGRTARLADKGDAVSSGDRLRIEDLRPSALAHVIPEPDLPLVVLASGAGWLAVDKPAGVPVHPLCEGETGTVLNALAARRPEVQGVGEAGLRSGVVHRLDVDTSGVLLLATTPRAWERLRAAFREHRVEKVYRAIVWGEFTAECHMQLGLVVAQHRPARVRVVAEGPEALRPGVWSVEQWVRPLEALGRATLVEVRPRTGFLHQVRATLAHLGHPIVGDAVYRAGWKNLPDSQLASRHMLHAAAVSIDDDIFAAAPDPADFAELVERLREEVRASGE